ADFVERGEQLHGVERLAVDRHRCTAIELDRDDLRNIGRILRRGGEHEQIIGGRGSRILEYSAFVRQMPDVRVARIDLLLGGSDGYAVRGSIRQRVFPASDVPYAPWRDHG